MLDLRHFSENPRNAQKTEARENQRTRLTKRLLRESLLDLLREKPVDHITVKELCEYAELNRSTFYAYYNDVPALYEEMGNELADSLLEYVQEMQEQTDVHTEPMLSYIQNNKEMFRLLVYCDHYTELNQAISRRIFRRFLDIQLRDALPYSSEERDYAFQFLFMGGTGVIHYWVQQNCKLPPRQVAQLIDRMIVKLLSAWTPRR